MKLSDSDLAAVMGVAPRPFDSPAETALTVWERLRSGSEDRWAGQKRVSVALEPGVASLLPAEGPMLIVKVALWHTPDEWSVEGPPRWLFVAAQRRMSEAGATRCRTAVLLAGGILKTGGMRADPEFQAALRSDEESFLEDVASGRAPEVADEADDGVTRRLWPRHDESVKALAPEASRLWSAIVELRKRGRETSRRRKTLEARMRRLIGSAEIAMLPDRRRLAIRKWGAGTKLVELPRS